MESRVHSAAQGGSIPSGDAERPLSKAPSLRVLVCGGRDYADYDAVCRSLDHIHTQGGGIFAIIHGNARGADTLAMRWALGRGVKHWPNPAHWSRDGKRAGPMRNQRMLGLGPHMVVAFPGGRGTADMVSRARKASVPVIDYAATDSVGMSEANAPNTPAQAGGKG